MLFDSGARQLGEPKELHPAERRKMAEEDCAYWFTKAGQFFRQHAFAQSEGHLSTAAFELHQVAERLYNAALLVFTHYKPKTHDLGKLNKRISSVDPQFLKVFPHRCDEDRRRFELLRSAYVDLKGYVIQADELAWLADRVRYLHRLLESLCATRIETYGQLQGIRTPVTNIGPRTAEQA